MICHADGGLVTAPPAGGNGYSSDVSLLAFRAAFFLVSLLNLGNF